MTFSAIARPRNDDARALLESAIAAEWTRLWTIRPTWILLASGTALMTVIATISVTEADSQAVPVWSAVETALFPASLLVFVSMIAVFVTTEYTTGTIRSTLQWTPRRFIVVMARYLVPVGVTTAWLVSLSLILNLTGWGIAAEHGAVLGHDILASLGRIALVVIFGSVLTVGVGLLTRNTAATLVIVFLLLILLPAALGATGVPWIASISHYLPGLAIVSTLAVDEAEIGTGTSSAVMITWSAATTLAGGWSLIRRDSN
jgi:ABC-2 type transport system permease protein